MEQCSTAELLNMLRWMCMSDRLGVCTPLRRRSACTTGGRWSCVLAGPWPRQHLRLAPRAVPNPSTLPALVPLSWLSASTYEIDAMYVAATKAEGEAVMGC